MFGDVQLVPAAMLHLIIKQWPLCCWALDFVGQIHLASSQGHRFMLVATDYFTKWTEAVSLKNMTHKEVIHFIIEHIVHRYDIPQTLTHQVCEFAEFLKIKLLSSLLYYDRV
jgi:hypothetical protein